MVTNMSTGKKFRTKSLKGRIIRTQQAMLGGIGNESLALSLHGKPPDIPIARVQLCDRGLEFVVCSCYNLAIKLGSFQTVSIYKKSWRYFLPARHAADLDASRGGKSVHTFSYDVDAVYSILEQAQLKSFQTSN